MPLDNSTKRGCVDCEKDWALSNTKQQIFPFRNDKKIILEDLPLCHNMYQVFLYIFHDH